MTQLLGMTLAVLLVCLPAFSQVNLGRLSGTVTDESGGTMANAKVTVTDQARGVSRTLTSDEAGAWAAPSLTPGMYTVHVEAMGFNISERKDIQVPVGGDIRADMAMKAGSQTQTVTVTEALPLINTTSATLGGVMQGNEVQDLPLIAHNYQTLLQFQPGVMSKPGGGANAHSSNGARSDGNNWLFEGLFTGGIRTAGIIVNQNSSTGDGASVVPPDAIQEMGISFQNKAEYGWKPGVASNVGVKSGTNGIHGTAFAVGQSDSLNARNPFNPAPADKPELNYQQYGATVGGPIKKDKLFYFVGFEGIKFTQGTPTSHTSVTTAMISGNPTLSIPAAYLDIRNKALAGTLTGGCVQNAFCPFSAANAAAIDATGKVVNPAALTSQQLLSLQLVNSGIFPSGLGDSKGNFDMAYTSQRDPSKNIVGKVDWHLSDKHQISGVYFWSKDTEIGDSGDVVQPYWTTDYYLTAQVTRLNWTYLPNSSWVNEFHFGFDRKVENQWETECRPGRTVAPPTTNYAFNTGAQGCFGGPDETLFAFPVFTIAGFDSLGGVGGQRRVEGYPAWADNVSYSRGNHNLKFGFETRHPYWNGGAYAGKKGSITFGSSTTAALNAFSGGAGGTATPLESFLLGIPATGSYISGNPNETRRNWAYGTFIQDDWRITPRITINLGMRWEYQTALTEDNNLEAVFDPNSPTGLTQLGSGIDSVWQPPHFASNLQPRTGVVWDVTGKGSTIVRAAWGLYSNWPIWSVVQGLGNNATGATYFRADGTSFQGTGTINNTTVSFPTQTAALGSNLVWNLTGPVFPSGAPKCGDNQTVVGGPNNGKKNPGTCAISAVDQNWQVPLMQEWTVGIQRAVGSKMSLDVSYVGSHGSNLFGTTDLNFPAVGDNSNSRVQTSRPYYSKFPWMGNISQVINRDFSNYNALQMTFNQRSWHGLTSTLGYTYGHSLDVAATDLAQGIFPDVRCPSCNYGPTPFDIRHRVTARLTYDLPAVKGFAQMLEGWSISSVVNLQGATPWAVSDASSNFSGTGKAERWNIFGDAKDFNSFGRTENVPCFGITGSKFGKDGACTTVLIPSGAVTAAAMVANMPAACVSAAAGTASNPAITQSTDITKHTTALASLADIGCYVAGSSVITPPAQGTFGNMGKGIFRSSAFHNWDVSVRKNMHIVERLNAQFQFDMYNVTNTAHFAIPGGNGNTSTNDLTTPANFGRSVATPNVSNGNVVGGSGDARRYQFGLKLTF
jgi:hypothetical protein